LRGRLGCIWWCSQSGFKPFSPIIDYTLTNALAYFGSGTVTNTPAYFVAETVTEKKVLLHSHMVI
jgi:hypothetical protein